MTLRLLLLRSLQASRDDAVNVDELIASVKFGQKSFNLDVDERTPCLEALFNGQSFDVSGRSESVQNLYHRYLDLTEAFPEELRGNALPYFVDWLLENVHLVEITAFSDEDAYTIFETMNDRGLSLTPTDMLRAIYSPTSMKPSAREQTIAGATASWRSMLPEGSRTQLLQSLAAKPVFDEDSRKTQRRHARGLRSNRYRIPPLAP